MRNLTDFYSIDKVLHVYINCLIQSISLSAFDINADSCKHYLLKLKRKNRNEKGTSEIRNSCMVTTDMTSSDMWHRIIWHILTHVSRKPVFFFQLCLEVAGRKFLRNANKVADYKLSNPKRRQTLKLIFTLNYNTLTKPVAALIHYIPQNIFQNEQVKYSSLLAKYRLMSEFSVRTHAETESCLYLEQLSWITDSLSFLNRLPFSASLSRLCSPFVSVCKPLHLRKRCRTCQTTSNTKVTHVSSLLRNIFLV